MSWTFLRCPLYRCPWHTLQVWCAPSCLLPSRATHRTAFCPAPLAAWLRAPDLACYPCSLPAPPWAPHLFSTCLTSRAAVCSTTPQTATCRSIRTLSPLLPDLPISLCSTVTLTTCPLTASLASPPKAMKGCPFSTAPAPPHTRWPWEWSTLHPLARPRLHLLLQAATPSWALLRASRICSIPPRLTSTLLEAITAPQIPPKSLRPLVTPSWCSTPPSSKELWATTR